MRRINIVGPSVVLALLVWAQAAPQPARADAGSTPPIDLSAWLPTVHSVSSAAVLPTGKLGYNIVRKSQYCPGLSERELCTRFRPRAVLAFLQIDNQHSGTSRVGTPSEIQVQCIQFATENGATIAHVGVGVLVPEGVPLGMINPTSSAGILSPDTPTTWILDHRSVAFSRIHGTYDIGYVRTRYSVTGEEVRNNSYQTPVAGGLTIRVEGTLIDFAYQGGGFVRTGYSQGQVSCLTGILDSPGPGSYSWGFNQVFSLT